MIKVDRFWCSGNSPDYTKAFPEIAGLSLGGVVRCSNTNCRGVVAPRQHARRTRWTGGSGHNPTTNPWGSPSARLSSTAYSCQGAPRWSSTNLNNAVVVGAQSVRELDCSGPDAAIMQAALVSMLSGVVVDTLPNCFPLVDAYWNDTLWNLPRLPRKEHMWRWEGHKSVFHHRRMYQRRNNQIAML